MAKKSKSFLTFRDDGSIMGGSTSIVTVLATGGGIVGVIRWFSAWRRYVFYPMGGNTLFDATCLKEIANELNAMMDKYVCTHPSKRGCMDAAKKK